MPYKTVLHRGRKYNIYKTHPSSKKKYKVKVGQKWVRFGAKGYRMFPSTKRGDSYCARSFGIKGVNDINSPNFWARKLWKCKGKKSMR